MNTKNSLDLSTFRLRERRVSTNSLGLPYKVWKDGKEGYELK
jgi:hypothetical protein